MRVSRSRKVVYSNWDSEIFTYELLPSDLMPDAAWNALTPNDRIEIMKLMEARVTQVLYQRMFVAGLIDERAYRAVIEPIAPFLRAWHSMFGGDDGRKSNPEAAGGGDAKGT